jgi:hypothetical protein
MANWLRQLRHERRKTTPHELGESRYREAIVKRFVGHPFSGQIGKQPHDSREAVGGPRGHCRHECPNSAKRRELSQTFDKSSLSPNGVDFFFRNNSFNPRRAPIRFWFIVLPSISLLLLVEIWRVFYAKTGPMSMSCRKSSLRCDLLTSNL